MRPTIADHALVLFQGDSITAAERDARKSDDLGQGFAGMIATQFAALRPTTRARFVNRAVSGDRVRDLLARWEADCIGLRPTLLSILIGINDVWRRYDSDDPTSLEDFIGAYRTLLTRTRDALPDIGVILCEPFVLAPPLDRLRWREDLDPKIQAVRWLACEFQAELLPLDGLFAQAASRRAAPFWLPDGVHPSPAGHALIAQSWLRAVRIATSDISWIAQ